MHKYTYALGMKVDACVATPVQAMRSPAAHSAMYAHGEYAHCAAGYASSVLTHSATLNEQAVLSSATMHKYMIRI